MANDRKHVLLQGLFVVLAALIGAAATLIAAWLGRLPEILLPPASATATVTVTATATALPAPTSVPTALVRDVSSEWVGEMSPLTEVGL